MKLLNILCQINEPEQIAPGSGKFFVTLIVILIMFAGIVGYLISIDRKIKKLEGKDKV